PVLSAISKTVFQFSSFLAFHITLVTSGMPPQYCGCINPSTIVFSLLDMLNFVLAVFSSTNPKNFFLDKVTNSYLWFPNSKTLLFFLFGVTTKTVRGICSVIPQKFMAVQNPI